MAKNGGLGFHLLNPHGPGGGVSCRLAGEKKGAVWTPRVQGGGVPAGVGPGGCPKKSPNLAGLSFFSQITPPPFRMLCQLCQLSKQSVKAFRSQNFQMVSPPQNLFSGVSSNANPFQQQVVSCKPSETLHDPNRPSCPSGQKWAFLFMWVKPAIFLSFVTL